jgi:hypothetical protein
VISGNVLAAWSAWLIGMRMAAANHSGAISKELSEAPDDGQLMWEVNMAQTAFKLIIGLLILSVPTLAQARCLGTVNQLRANNVKSRWQETGANDGKPLKISITNGPSGLVYSAKKAGVLWLTGNVSICLSGAAKEITLKNTKATNNVPMFARMAFPSTQTAQIVNDQIRLGGGGWDGTFAGQ